MTDLYQQIAKACKELLKRSPAGLAHLNVDLEELKRAASYLGKDKTP